MQQLETIFNRLKSDPLYAVRIVNADTGAIICTQRTGEQMANQSGSVEDFFNDLFANGVQNITIQPQRKNGSSYKTDGPLQKFSFAPAQPQQAPQQPQPAPPAHYPQPALNAPALDAGALFGGLNAAEVAFRHQHYPEVKLENAELKLENRSLKEKIEELKEKILESKYDSDKAAGNSRLLETLTENAPALLGALGNLKNPTAQVATAGLGHPTGLSKIKDAVIEHVTTHSDSVNGYILATFSGLSNNEFAEEWQQLLLKHNLIQ